MKKKILAIMLCVVMVIGILPVYAFAEDEQSVWTYSVVSEVNKTAAITKYNANEEVIVIPEYIDGYKIVTIGKEAFQKYGTKNYKSIYIPDTVSGIGESAFSFCGSVTQWRLPATLKTIGKRAFEYCKGLTEITTDATLIGEDAFDSSGLVRVTMNKVHTIGNYAFNNCKSLEEVYIDGDTVEKIGNHAFSSTAIKNINIDWNDKHNKKTVSVGEFAFDNCYSLETVYIKRVRGIGNYCFSDCKLLRSFKADRFTCDVGEYAFEDCAALTSVELGGESYSHRIEDCAFKGCTSLKDFTIPLGTTYVGGDCFSSSLETVVVPQSVERMHELNNAWPTFKRTIQTIYGYSGTYAETYANENGIEFVDLVGGDVDGDGVYTVNDLGAITDMSLDDYYNFFYSLLQRIFADVNRDSVVDGFDISVLDRILSGLGF